MFPSVRNVMVAALIVGTSVAFAQAPGAGPGDRSGGGAAEFSALTPCQEAQFTAAEAELARMSAGQNKTAAQRELTSAKQMMAQNDLAACRTHMTNFTSMIR
jgi:hypothetical protein